MQKGRPDMTFMQHDDSVLTEPSVPELIREAVHEMLAPYGKRGPERGLFSDSQWTPFDISKPNQHDTKADYLRERELVETCIKHLDGVFEVLLPVIKDEETRMHVQSAWTRQDGSLRESVGGKDLDSVSALVLKNAVDVGATNSLLHLSYEYRASLRSRLKELDEQRDRYWNIKHRAPDYYAREIALRLARLFTREVGERPTLGTSAIDGQPSTSYARALAKVFETLEIKTNPRSPAEWAVGQIKESDTEPPVTLGQILSDYAAIPQAPQSRPLNALARNKSGED